MPDRQFVQEALIAVQERRSSLDRIADLTGRSPIDAHPSVVYSERRSRASSPPIELFRELLLVVGITFRMPGLWTRWMSVPHSGGFAGLPSRNNQPKWCCL